MGNIVWSAEKSWHDGPEVSVSVDERGRLKVNADRYLNTPLTLNEGREIAASIAARLALGEDIETAILVVLFNIGDRQARCACVAGEWSGLKRDLPPTQGIPKCPNGHVLTQEAGPKLGYLRERVAS